MKYIGPHKSVSYINPDNVNEDKHIWLSADDWSKKVKEMLASEPPKEHYVGALELNLEKLKKEENVSNS